jgi:hypothetical protein
MWDPHVGRQEPVGSCRSARPPAQLVLGRDIAYALFIRKGTFNTSFHEND